MQISTVQTYLFILKVLMWYNVHIQVYIHKNIRNIKYVTSFCCNDVISLFIQSCSCPDGVGATCAVSVYPVLCTLIPCPALCAFVSCVPGTQDTRGVLFMVVSLDFNCSRFERVAVLFDVPPPLVDDCGSGLASLLPSIRFFASICWSCSLNFEPMPVLIFATLSLLSALSAAGTLLVETPPPMMVAEVVIPLLILAFPLLFTLTPLTMESGVFDGGGTESSRQLRKKVSILQF